MTSSIVLKDLKGLRCEHVQIVFSSSHPLSTELEVVLTSPSGTKSVLAQLHAVMEVPNVTLTASGHSYSFKSPTIASFGSYPKNSVFGTVVVHPDLACNGNTFPTTKVYANKVVLVKRGSCPFVEKAINLANLGSIVRKKACMISNFHTLFKGCHYL